MLDMSNPTIQTRSSLTRTASGRFARITWAQPSPVEACHAAYDPTRRGAWEHAVMMAFRQPEADQRLELRSLAYEAWLEPVSGWSVGLLGDGTYVVTSASGLAFTA